ncbi:MAG: segregation/condensation protein A [Fimbriimonadaceae bacterium]|nr:segregation/condensation protein A [Alphaproteobacteria bacterium]
MNGPEAANNGLRDPFTEGEVRRNNGNGDKKDALIVDVQGFEGPLDLLLTLARDQKVDLAHISILALVEQYLEFIAELRRMRLEVAADYLVMAAWLAYLKSRLLLPDSEGDEDDPSGEELAAALAFRLQRLEAMRDAAARLMNRNRLGRDVFASGAPQGVRIDRKNEYVCELYDLLKAYAFQRENQSVTHITMRRQPVITIKEARVMLRRLVGQIADWAPMDMFLSEYVLDGKSRTSAISSTFSASLELAHEGVIELRQTGVFAPIYMRGIPNHAPPELVDRTRKVDPISES